ncbi:transposase [Ectothiorhodospiraceae bacterium BW-2]|nr:transposase [Ectothiorhodospiraceae bacterium BW-2]
MQHDNAYKNLFSHRQMVEDLLRGYINEPWVEQLDYTTLERCSGEHVSDDLRDREDDIIDRWMALRVMVYTGLLYQSLIKQKLIKPGKKLPPVFPIVIYNGDTPWSAARNVNQLIEAVPGGLQIYMPSQRYHLLDEGRTSYDIANNHFSDILELENNPDLKQIETVVARLTKQLKGEHNRELRRAFTIWINRMVLKRLAPADKLPEINELSEVQSMLAERMTQLTQEWKQEGVQQGESKILERQIIRRFGFNALNNELRQKLASATIEELEQWGDNFVDAQTLEEVFQPESRP